MSTHFNFRRHHHSKHHAGKAASPPPITPTSTAKNPAAHSLKPDSLASPASPASPAAPPSLFFKSHSRSRSKFIENASAALALPFSVDELTKIKNNIGSLTKLTKQFILEHAKRRVDLFFYTLIAYHNSKEIPSESHTHMQHGRGRNTIDEKTLTQACHSSITPGLVDLDSKTQQTKESILEHTHFMDSLNATVELPAYFNELDEKIEQHYECRKKSIDILRKVSIGELNPIQGLINFLELMKGILKQIKNEFHKCNLIKHMELVDLISDGTIAYALDEKTKSIKNEYIHLLLRLTETEKKLCETPPAMKEKIYNDKMDALKIEILQSKSTYQPPKPKTM